MISDLTTHIARMNELPEALAERAVGILLNAADRQDAPLAKAVFRKIPGARVLSARVGAEIGAPTGEIARLIERTPGGRRHVVAQMFSALLAAGLGHDVISRILPQIGAWMLEQHGIDGLGNIGAVIAQDEADSAMAAVRAA